MAKRKYWKIASKFFFGVSAIAFLTTAFALGPLGVIPSKVRAQTILSSSLIIFLCIAGLAWIALDKKRSQIQAWRRAFSLWKENAWEDANLESQVPIPASTEALEQFTIRIFSRLGYRLLHHGHTWSGYMITSMLNPEGEIELIQCIHRDAPVSLSEVCDLFEAMSEAGARRGIFWSPGGFHQNAAFWAQGKPLLLVDQPDIHRFVRSVFAVLGEDI